MLSLLTGTAVSDESASEDEDAGAPSPRRSTGFGGAACSNRRLPPIALAAPARVNKAILPGMDAADFSSAAAGFASARRPPTPPRAHITHAWGHWAHQPDAACAACAAAGSACFECGNEPGSSEASHFYADEAWSEETDGDSAFDGEHSDSRDPTEPVQRRGELWAAKSVYPAGIASLLDEENLAAAREYECPCGNKCLSRVSFIDVYEFRKECVRYTLASFRLVAHACTSTDPATCVCVLHTDLAKAKPSASPQPRKSGIPTRRTPSPASKLGTTTTFALLHSRWHLAALAPRRCMRGQLSQNSSLSPTLAISTR